VTVQALVDADAAASDDDKLTYLFLADATTITETNVRVVGLPYCLGDGLLVD